MTGAELIAAEREKQIGTLHWTPKHDDGYTACQLVRAALCYATYAMQRALGAAHFGKMPDSWPWEKKWWKPDVDPVKNLVVAGALIAAEIDRLSRLRAAEKADVVWIDEEQAAFAAVHRCAVAALAASEPPPASTGCGPGGNPKCPKCHNSSQNVAPADRPDLLRCATCKTVFAFAGIEPPQGTPAPAETPSKVKYLCGCTATEEGARVFPTCPYHRAGLERDTPAAVVARLSDGQLTAGIPGVTPEAACAVRDRIVAVLQAK